MYYPGICQQDGGTLLKTSGQPMASKDSNQASSGYKSRPLAPHQFVRCWTGFIQSAPEHRFNTVPTGFNCVLS